MSWLRTAGLRMVLAMGLGFALWIFVSYTENPDRLIEFKDLPIKPEGLAPGLVIVDQNGLPNTALPVADIKLRAIGNTATTPSSSDIQAYVNLTEHGPGEESVPVGVRVTLPGRQPEVAEINPDLLSIRIEQEITHTVPLTIEMDGSVPFSYESLAARATLQGKPITEVSVHGPQSRVERVKAARAIVNIDGRTASYDSPRQLVAIGEDGQVIDGVVLDPTTLNVQVPIVSSAGIKRVPVVPSVVGDPASGYVVAGLSVDPQFVRVAGGSGSLESIQSVQTEEVNIQGASRTISYTVQLQDPVSTPLLSDEPVSATVTVEITPIDRQFQVTLPIPVQLIDVPPGLIGSLSPAITQVTFTGSSGQLGRIDPSALQASVSAKNLGIGSYPSTPSVTAPAGIMVLGQPSRVTIVLRSPPSPTPELTGTLTLTQSQVLEPTETPKPQAPAETPKPQAPGETPTAAEPELPTATPEAATPAPTETPVESAPQDTPTPEAPPTAEPSPAAPPTTPAIAEPTSVPATPTAGSS